MLPTIGKSSVMAFRTKVKPEMGGAGMKER